MMTMVQSLKDAVDTFWLRKPLLGATLNEVVR